MIHMELGPSMIVGLGFSIIGLILYLIRTNKPDVSRGTAWNVLQSINLIKICIIKKIQSIKYTQHRTF